MNLSNQGNQEVAGEIDRRTFLRRSGGVLLLTSTGGLSALLAACTGNGSAESTSSTSTTLAGTTSSTLAGTTTSVVSGAPDAIYHEILPDLPRGGSAVIAITALADNLNSLGNTLGNIQWMSDPVHDFLERYDHTGRLRTSLAESFEQVDDVTLRYVLREGVQFHNGRTLVAQDVADTIGWIQDPANASAKASIFEGVQVNPIDDRTVDIVLLSPDAGFRHQLPRLPIIPIEDVDSMDDAPVGCGPFTFVEWVRDSHLSFTRFDDYWNTGAPPVDDLRIELRSDAQGAASSFLAGEFDALAWVPTAQATQFIDQAGSDHDVVQPTPGWWFMGINHEAPPFDDPRINHAMALAADRETIAQVAGPGTLPMMTAPVPPDHPWYLDLPVERDLDTARALLAEAGYDDNAHDITIRAINDVTERIAVVLQSNLAEVGMTVNVELTDTPTYVEQRTEGDYQLYVSGWFMTQEPAFVLDVIMLSDSTANYWRYSNDRVDELLREAKAVIGDDERRKELYQEAMQISFIEDPVMLCLCTQTETMAYRLSLNGDQCRPDPGPLWHFPIVAKA